MCSRRHLSRPKIRSIRLDVVKCINSSLLIAFVLWIVGGVSTINVVSASLLSPSPTPLIWQMSIVLSLVVDVPILSIVMPSHPPPLFAFVSICLLFAMPADCSRFTVAVLFGVLLSAALFALPHVVGLTVAISADIVPFTAADFGATATTIGGVELRAGKSGNLGMVVAVGTVGAAAATTLPVTDAFLELTLISGDA